MHVFTAYRMGNLNFRIFGLNSGHAGIQRARPLGSGSSAISPARSWLQFCVAYSENIHSMEPTRRHSRTHTDLFLSIFTCEARCARLRLWRISLVSSSLSIRSEAPNFTREEAQGTVLRSRFFRRCSDSSSEQSSRLRCLDGQR